MSAARKFKTGAMSWASASGAPPAFAPTPKAALGWPPASRRDASDLTEELRADPPERRRPPTEESREPALCYIDDEGAMYRGPLISHGLIAIASIIRAQWAADRNQRQPTMRLRHHSGAVRDDGADRLEPYIRR
jgi:hypothetical protein